MPAGTDYETYTYCVDSADSIIFVNDAWCAFATANDAPELTAEAVLHCSLWGFIADPETTHLYREIFARTRRSGNAVTIPFRCDAPALRRYMQLDIQPLDGGRLRLTGRILRLERRAPVALLDRGVERGRELLRMCSWCKRIAVSADQWLEAEDAIVRLGLFDTPKLPGLTHTICDSCLAGLSPA